MTSIHLEPNAVTYTVLIKGQCQEGLIPEALSTLTGMISEGIDPNIRTFNTILRGCWRNGALTEARTTLRIMKSQRVKPDSTSYEYFIRTLCENSRVKKACEMARKPRYQRFFHSGMYAAIATAAALKGLFNRARRNLRLARKSGKMKNGDGKGKRPKAGKKNSVEMFLEIKKEEIARECSRVKLFLESKFCHSLLM